MTTQRTLLSAVALCAAPILALEASDPTPAPPGPGGVIAAVKDFLSAVDRGDAAYLTEAIADQGGGAAYGFDQPGEKIDRREAAVAFYDVGMSGESLTSHTKEQFVERVVKDVAGGGKLLQTQIRSIRADCPSGHCSWAVIEFDRVFGDGDHKRVIPMRATALVQHVGSVGSTAPQFRVFHWHASRAAERSGSRKTGELRRG